MKNKYQEALYRFKVTAHNDWTFHYEDCKDDEKTVQVNGTRCFEIDGEAIKTLGELVDKATPCKPIKTRCTNKCPRCKNTLPLKENALKKKAPKLYCDRCGQRIDWSKAHG